MEYPTLTEARTWKNGNGLFHNNCRHSLSIYIEGVTDIPRQRSQSEVARDRELYALNQRINRVNISIRRWRRRREVAFMQRDRQRANARLTQLYQERKDLESRL